MTETPQEARIYSLGQSLGRLEGQVEALAQSLQREHDERIAAMKAQEARADAIDKRIEGILGKLAEQIGKLSESATDTKTGLVALSDKRDNNVSASRWFIGIALMAATALGSVVSGIDRRAAPQSSSPCTAPLTTPR